MGLLPASFLALGFGAFAFECAGIVIPGMFMGMD